jgi:transcriptional regulator with XRE-family HTH domain
MDLSRKLKQFMLDRELNQTLLAQTMNYDPSTVSKLLGGVISVSLNFKLAFFNAFGAEDYLNIFGSDLTELECTPEVQAWRVLNNIKENSL